MQKVEDDSARGTRASLDDLSIQRYSETMAKGFSYQKSMELWRAYLEVLSERVPLVDHWRDGTVTWHPRVVRKMLWYSGRKDTMRNRRLAYDWLMRHATKPAPSSDLAPARSYAHNAAGRRVA